MLRERINDVAAEVARLTALEGPNSPIESILAGDTGRPQRNRRAARHQRRQGQGERYDRHPAAGKATLADRIRALQSTPTRAPSN